MTIGRYGGEEFIIYQRYNCHEQAIKTLENIRQEIRSTLFFINHEVSTHVTVSIGASKIEHYSKIQETVKKADMNLYTAKKNGRDQLIVSNEFTSSRVDN